MRTAGFSEARLRRRERGRHEWFGGVESEVDQGPRGLGHPPAEGVVLCTWRATLASTAADLLRAIDVAEGRAREAYATIETPRMEARLEAARERLGNLVA